MAHAATRITASALSIQVYFASRSTSLRRIRRCRSSRDVAITTKQAGQSAVRMYTSSQAGEVISLFHSIKNAK